MEEDVLKCVCVCVRGGDAVDSWIPPSHPGAFTPSEEHHMPMMPVKTVTISPPTPPPETHEMLLHQEHNNCSGCFVDA